MKRLKICQVNVRSLLASSKLLDLELLCASADIDVLCVTETWLSSKVTSPQVSLPGFQSPFRCDRPNSYRGGGLAVYVRLGLAANSVYFHDQLEAVCVRILLPKRETLYM